MGQRENAVTNACLNLLVRYGGCFAWRQNSGGARVIGRGGKPRVMRFGGLPGAADIIGVISKGPHRGRAIAVEAKAPAGDPVFTQTGKRSRTRAGVQSADQKEWQRQFEEAGGVYVCCSSSEVLENKLIELGILQRAGWEDRVRPVDNIHP